MTNEKMDNTVKDKMYGIDRDCDIPLYDSVEEAVEEYLDNMDEDEVKQIPPETKVVVEEYERDALSISRLTGDVRELFDNLVEDLDEDYGSEDHGYGDDLLCHPSEYEAYEALVKETAERFAKLYKVHNFLWTGHKIEVELRDYLPKATCQGEEEETK